MSKLKLITINPFTRIVAEIEMHETLHNFQELVDGLIAVGLWLPNGDALIINDEGLLRNDWTSPTCLRSTTNSFSLHGYVFRGPAYIIGTDEQSGDSISCLSTLKSIQEQIEFLWDDREPGVPELVSFETADELFAALERNKQ